MRAKQWTLRKRRKSAESIRSRCILKYIDEAFKSALPFTCPIPCLSFRNSPSPPSFSLSCALSFHRPRSCPPPSPCLPSLSLACARARAAEMGSRVPYPQRTRVRTQARVGTRTHAPTQQACAGARSRTRTHARTRIWQVKSWIKHIQKESAKAFLPA